MDIYYTTTILFIIFFCFSLLCYHIVLAWCIFK